MTLATLVTALTIAGSCVLPSTSAAGTGPGPSDAPGWQRTGPSSTYDRSTLSHLLDGGAEVYLDYGFAHAESQDYASGEVTITCTFYEMVDPAAAFGVFSYFRGGRKAPLAIGDAAFGSESQIAFWQDRYFVTIEMFSPDASRLEQLKTFAAEVSARIATHAALPPILQRLPAGRIAGSEELLRGRVAVNALYTAWPSAALADRGDAPVITARYGEATLWLLPYQDRASLDAAWDRSVSKLRPDAGCEAPSGTSDLACIREGHAAAARRVGPLLAIVSGARSLERAHELLDRVTP